MVAPVITLPRQALGCGRRHNIGDQSRLGDMTTVAAPSRAARLGKSCLRSGACTLRYPLRSSAGRGVRVPASVGLERHHCMPARCRHCSTCISDQMLRRITPTAERTVTRGGDKKPLTKETRLENGPSMASTFLALRTIWLAAVICPASVGAEHMSAGPESDVRQREGGVAAADACQRVR